MTECNEDLGNDDDNKRENPTCRPLHGQEKETLCTSSERVKKAAYFWGYFFSHDHRSDPRKLRKLYGCSPKLYAKKKKKIPNTIQIDQKNTEDAARTSRVHTRYVRCRILLSILRYPLNPSGSNRPCISYLLGSMVIIEPGCTGNTPRYVYIEV
jgi:hypothetical protein